MDEDIVQTLTLSNGVLARNPDEKRTIPLEISFTRTPEPIVLPHKDQFLKFLVPRTDLFGSRNRSVCYTERTFLEFVFREPIYSVHGTDPFATQNANFLNLYFRNRLAGSTEPIDLLHRTLNSQNYFSGASLTACFRGTDCLKRQFHTLDEFELSWAARLL